MFCLKNVTSIFFLGQKVGYYGGFDKNTPINLKITFRDNYFEVSINGVSQEVSIDGVNQGGALVNTSNRTEQPLYLGANIINNVVTRFGKMKLSKFSFKYIK